MTLSDTKSQTVYLPPRSTYPDDAMLQDAEQLLEFDRVREMLAQEARFYMSREIVRASKPSSDPQEVARLQDETAEAVVLLSAKGDIGLAGMRDPRDPLRRAILGGMLNGSELLLLAGIFQSMWIARSTVMTIADNVPLLADIAFHIRDLRETRNNIVQSLSDVGDVLDTATPRLERLRERSRNAYRRSMRTMEQLASSENIRPYLQSNIVASRGERLVLEVKSSHREFVRGIVHDISSTGQTSFIEPFQVVDIVNQWRQTAYEARKEEERVLRKLSRSIAKHGEGAMASLQAAAKLDAIVARARLSSKMGGVRPNSSFNIDTKDLTLINARHPLIGDSAVPISIEIDAERRGLVITGPNTGGKTVALKTLGLVALMHQIGMHIPAMTGSNLPVFDGVYADIGDAQSIDRSVSTFSSHMERVIKIVQRATHHSMVLLDELGTGTDPEEGSAIARAVLDHLVRRNIWTCVTTHHRQVAEFAANHDQLLNASVELDSETMLPNYRLIMGLPGRSYAMQVAKRLGLEQSIIDQAETMLDPFRSQAQSLLETLQRERDQVREVQTRATQDRAQAQRIRSEAEEYLASAEQERHKAIEQVRDQLKQESQRVRRQLRRLMREAQRNRSWEEARQSTANIVRHMNSDEWVSSTASPIFAKQNEGASKSSVDRREDAIPKVAPTFSVGDVVCVESLGLTGEIIELDRENRAVVLSGNIRFQARPHMMTLVKPDVAEEKGDTSVSSADHRGSTLPSHHSTSVSRMSNISESVADIDVRGSRVYMIESVIPKFIDRAFMQGLTTVRIIHGEGSGALRQAVRDILVRETHVEAFRAAPPNNGGNGVTIATLE